MSRWKSSVLIELAVHAKMVKCTVLVELAMYVKVEKCSKSLLHRRGASTSASANISGKTSQQLRMGSRNRVDGIVDQGRTSGA